MHPLPLVCGAGFSEASCRRSKSANIAGSFKNKVQSTMAQVTPDKVTAEMHRKLSEPGLGLQGQGPRPGRQPVIR